MAKEKINYVAVKFAPETVANLKEYCRKHGFKMSDEFHTTIIYSRETSPCFVSRLYKVNSFKLYPKKFEIFDNNTPVLLLEQNAGLNRLYEFYQTIFGLKSKWPDYKPHISLSYDYEGSKEDLLLTPLPDFDITVDRVFQNVSLRDTDE